MFVGAAGSTIAVCAELVLVVPPALVALTMTRSVVPTSPASREYVSSSAPESAAQFEPDPSQRCHAYAYDVGEPLHVPVVALST